MNPLLQNWLEDALNDEIVISPDNMQHEASQNTWGFTIPLDKGITSKDLSRFINEILRKRKTQISQPATFYVWYEAQSGHLSFSVSSQSRENLPFKCNLDHSDSLNEIIDLCLASNNEGVIPLSECEDVPFEEAFVENECIYTQKIWSTSLV